MMRIWLAGLLGGVAMFVWGALSHMVLPIGSMGLQSPPVEKEPALLNSLREALPESGVYFLPGMEGFPKPSAEQEAAYHAKALVGPRGLLVYQRDGADTQALMPRQLVQQFVTCLGCGLLAAFLLASAGGLNGYLPRVYFCTILGLTAFLASDAPNWIWYGYSSVHTFGKLLENVIGFTCTGAVIGLVLPRRG
ncbi:MAG: hypothetical protein FJ299_01895 [Planctomycetes bacterium]|nr:hypothetical protein [Planctomycetota bacterium]